MEGSTRTSLWLFLLLNQLRFCLTHAQLNSTETAITNATEKHSFTTNDHTNSDEDNNGTHCLINTEMRLIAVGSAGGLILCLLVATVVLACQVCHLQRRVYAPRTSRSNMDLVSGTGYWGTDLAEASAGLVGPCGASVILEEVRADSRMEDERQAEIREAEDGAWAELEEGATAMAFDPEEKASQMQSSSSRDSCQEVPSDLGNMPLVV